MLSLRHSLSAAILLLSWGAVPAADPTEEIQDLTLQWTGLERQRNLLDSNWRSEEPVLEQQLALLERERSELTELLEETAQDQDEVEARRLDLLDRQTQLEEEQAQLEIELEASIERVQSLYNLLPPPMIAAWEERLPELESDYLTTSERLQVVLEMLGELDDFHRRIGLHQEVMTMPDGQDYLVRQLYLGLSHGWYVSADGRFAGAGRAGPTGWQWRESADAEAIERVISILERRRNAELLALPVELGEP
jgi:multidrug efflux pump subunit AcrA (membrane-fusion protein)